MADAAKCISELSGYSLQDVNTELARLRIMDKKHPFQAVMPLLVEEKEADGKAVIPSAGSRRRAWAVHGKDMYPACAEAARRLLSFHVTSCSTERNWSLWGSTYTKARSKLALETGTKLITIRGASKESMDVDHVELNLRTIGNDED